MRQVSIAAFLILSVNLVSTATRAEEPTITRLEMRDRAIVITSDSDGLKYSIVSPDGTVLDAKLSEAQLADKHPELYDRVRPAIADEANSDVIPWAGM
jgi:hypothetical protein